jgi:hypothetical protein
MKKDPIFGVEALERLAQKAAAKIKPDPKLRLGGPHRLRVRSTKWFRERMRYLYGDESDS